MPTSTVSSIRAGPCRRLDVRSAAYGFPIGAPSLLTRRILLVQRIKMQSGFPRPGTLTQVNARRRARC